MLNFILAILILPSTVQSKALPVLTTSDTSRSLFQKSSTLAPIRIFYHYQNFNLGSPAQNTEFQSQIIKFVDNYLKSSLKVFSYTDNLAVSEEKCGPLINVPIEHIDPGIANFDYIVYLTTYNSETDAFASYSGICDLDSTERNAVSVGYVAINSVRFNLLGLKEKFVDTLQEMIRILGFSTELYPYWKNVTGQIYENSKAFGLSNVRGGIKSVIRTPNLLAQARQAFACQSLFGVELEEYLQTGFSSSWDSRIMFGDLMASSIQQDTILSTVTLALLQDSGWYQVDYSYSQMPIFGRSSGCNYIDIKCVQNGLSSDPNLWCTNVGEMACDSYANSKATCNIVTWTSIPSAFQYFTSSNLGGGDPYTDFCPYNKPFPSGHCKGSQIGSIYDSRTSEVFSAKSKCFRSTLIKSPDTFQNVYAACYEILSCDSVSATVKIADNIISCPFAGATVSVPGYSGVIYCPNSDVLCRDAPCPNACFGSGKCLNGICFCNSGYSGVDCSIICSSNCKTCSTSSTCIECQDGSFLFSGVCTPCITNCKLCASATACGNCLSGYFLLTSTSCAKCGSTCLECKSSTICQTCVVGRYLTVTFTCAVCPSNCDYCSSSTICNTCKKGYYLTSSNTCAICSSTCAACISATLCIECKTGYYVTSTNTCVLCSTTCSQCTSATVCSSCKAGYYLTSELTCASCTKGCTSCSIFESCKVCGSGYFYLASTNKCGTCISGCSKCNNTSTCTTCRTGYYLNSLSKCTICTSTCSACSSASVCTICKSGFYLSGESCLACSSPCKACSSSTTCLSCVNTYYLSSGSCLSCSSPCINCSSSTVCTSCVLGTYLSLGTCTSCLSTCASCTSLTLCLTCVSGYTLISGVCQ